MTQDRDLALILLAGIIGITALVAGTVLVCLGHLKAGDAALVIAAPSGLGIAALGRLGGPKQTAP